MPVPVFPTAASMLAQPFIIPAGLFILLSIPLVTGSIPRNGWYGVRTRQTLSDEKTWYEANMLGGWCFLSSGVIYCLAAAFFPCVTASGTNFPLWWLHAFALIFPVIASLLMIRRFLRTRQA